MAKPIMQFKNIAQAKRCLREWQRRLFLEDWTIDLRLVKPKEIPGRQGETDWESVNQSAVIKVARVKHQEYIQKVCAEKVLVHELLHCKYNVRPASRNYLAQHQLLEQMAKSLIMAKYNLPFKWFLNI